MQGLRIWGCSVFNMLTDQMGSENHKQLDFLKEHFSTSTRFSTAYEQAYALSAEIVYQVSWKPSH